MYNLYYIYNRYILGRIPKGDYFALLIIEFKVLNVLDAEFV